MDLFKDFLTKGPRDAYGTLVDIAALFLFTLTMQLFVRFILPTPVDPKTKAKNKIDEMNEKLEELKKNPDQHRNRIIELSGDIAVAEEDLKNIQPGLPLGTIMNMAPLFLSNMAVTRFYGSFRTSQILGTLPLHLVPSGFLGNLLHTGVKDAPLGSITVGACSFMIRSIVASIINALFPRPPQKNAPNPFANFKAQMEQQRIEAAKEKAE